MEVSILPPLFHCLARASLSDLTLASKCSPSLDTDLDGRGVPYKDYGSDPFPPLHSSDPIRQTRIARISPQIPTATAGEGPFSWFKALVEVLQKLKISEDDAVNSAPSKPHNIIKYDDPKLADPRNVQDLNTKYYRLPHSPFDLEGSMPCQRCASRGIENRSSVAASSEGSIPSIPSIPSTVSITSGNTSHKRVRTHGKDSMDDDNDDEPPRPPKKNGAPSNDPESAGFACPFRKHNPWRYNALDSKWRVCMNSFSSVARVKEHLIRRHKITCCPRCWTRFKNNEQVDCHLREEDCIRKPRPPLEGIDDEVEKQLRSRKKPSSKQQSDVEKWCDVFRLLFPNEEVPTPYFIPEGEQSSDLEAYLREELPRLVRSGVETSLQELQLPYEASVADHLVRVIEDCQERAFRTYRDRTAFDLSTPRNLQSSEEFPDLVSTSDRHTPSTNFYPTMSHSNVPLMLPATASNSEDLNANICFSGLDSSSQFTWPETSASDVVAPTTSWENETHSIGWLLEDNTQTIPFYDRANQT